MMMRRTDEQFLGYINYNFFPSTPRCEVAKLLDLYPSDPTAGAP